MLINILRLYNSNDSHKFVFHIDDNGCGPLLFNITNDGVQLYTGLYSTDRFQPDLTHDHYTLKIIGVDLV